jgi:DNA mismatch repair protein MutS2
MMNASVDLDPQSLEPTYRVTLGLPGRSYALTIAARLGISPDIIKQAQSLMSPAERAAEDLLRDLREERLIVERLRRESEEALAEIKLQQAEVEERLASVEAAKVELVEAARRDLQDQIRDVADRLRKAERLLRQVQPASTTVPELAEAVRAQRAELSETRRHLSATRWQPIELKRVPWQERLNSGDRVFIRGIPRPVEIITPPNETDQVEVLLGTMRARIPLYQLERLAEPAIAARNATSEITTSGNTMAGNAMDAPARPGFRRVPGGGVYFSRPRTGRPAVTEINLHGHRVDEALEKVEKLVSDASRDGAMQVRIDHGRGTGALRRAIREYLTGHPLVASWGPEPGPSGDGVTVVDLK